MHRVLQMDLGLDRPGAREALHTALDTIALTDERATELLTVNVGNLGLPGSSIAKLLGVLPDPPVDLRITMLAGGPGRWVDNLDPLMHERNYSMNRYILVRASFGVRQR